MGYTPVSIVIPTLNEEKYLPKLLDSLRAIRNPIDVIVVDGKSEDTTGKIVFEYVPYFTGESSLRLITSEIRSPSHQRNLGAAEARYNVLIFSDADVVVKNPDSIEKIISRFAEKDHVVAAPRLVPLEKGIHIYLTYVTAHAVEIAFSVFGRHGFPGSFIVTRKDIFDKVGGFDSDILLAEDIDYCLRASKHGSAGVYPIKIHVSARRFIKYGYVWILKEWKNIIRLITTGRVSQDIVYPFGEFRD